MVCDFAEAYGIFNYRSLPVPLIATLAVGLKDDSRVMMAASGMKVSQEKLLLAAIVDYLAILVWTKTKNGQKNKNKPKSLYEALTGEAKADNIVSFNSPEEFERARERILRGEADGN